MSAISSSLGASSQARSSSDAYSSLNSEEFLKIMFTELTNQDPLAPNQTKDILEQLSTIRSIESDVTLGKTLDNLVKQNEITAAGSLVGKFVAGRSSGGQNVAGYVGSVSVTREGTMLNLGGGVSVPLSRVEEIIDSSVVDAATGAGG